MEVRIYKFPFYDFDYQSILLVSRIEHQRLHEQHKGHEKMHAEMMLILILTLVVAQFALIEWKKRHYRSYSVTHLINRLIIHSSNV